MNEYIYLEFLIEDKSGGILIDEIMKKYAEDREGIAYRVKSFRGIGKIPRKINKMSIIKSHKLLNDLPNYLKGLNNSLKGIPYNKKAIFVILDSDDENCVSMKKSLLEMYDKLDVSIQVFFCIAIEEMEAWLLGDTAALTKAFPLAKRQVLQNYKQDSIVGTWELLADAIYKGGVIKLKEESESYYEIGIQKCFWAKEIGIHMDIRNNNSPSFRYFISKLDLVCD